MHFFLVLFLGFGATVPGATFLASGEDVSCDESTAGQFTVCAEDSKPGTGGGSSGSSGPAMRECRYFANGTIDIPTLTVITAWVPVGSRPCIGDVVAEPSSSSGTWQTQEEIELREKFTALATRPKAWWNPGQAVEFLDPVELHLQAQTEVVIGDLLGKEAHVRFRPVAVRWECSDGSVLFGFHKIHSFENPGSYQAQARVKYEVDYRYAAGNWVFNAAHWELTSNKLTIPVIERQRLTLLVG